MWQWTGAKCDYQWFNEDNKSGWQMDTDAEDTALK